MVRRLTVATVATVLLASCTSAAGSPVAAPRPACPSDDEWVRFTNAAHPGSGPLLPEHVGDAIVCFYDSSTSGGRITFAGGVRLAGPAADKLEAAIRDTKPWPDTGTGRSCGPSRGDGALAVFATNGGPDAEVAIFTRGCAGLVSTAGGTQLTLAVVDLITEARRSLKA